jgi:hypothetical protein
MIDILTFSGSPEFVAKELKDALNNGYEIINFTSAILKDDGSIISRCMPISCVYLKKGRAEKS